MIDDLFRVYAPIEVGVDGYPAAWHVRIKHDVRAAAGHRCIRCGHPYRNGEHGNGEWSPCDEHCTHIAPAGGDVRIRDLLGEMPTAIVGDDGESYLAGFVRGSFHVETTAVEAHWRILTVHHLDMNKKNCRWWNLVALCQRCHLQVQGRVQMQRVWPWEHSEWFRPYVAGFYASSYLGEELARDEVEARLDELLALERAA